MAEKPDNRFSLRLNAALVLTEMGRWPVATLALLVLIAGLLLMQFEREYRLQPIETALVLAGQLTGVLGGKTVWLLLGYPRLIGRFPGSYLVATFMAFIPTMAFYASALYLLNINAEKPLPLYQAIIFLLFAYVTFSLLCAAFFRAHEWMFQGWHREPGENT